MLKNLGKKIGKLLLPSFFSQKIPSNSVKNNNLREYAQLANVSYKKDDERTLPEFPDAKYLPRYSDERIAVFKDDKNKVILVSFRGTADLTDVKTDIFQIALGVGKDTHPDYYNADRTITTLEKTYPSYNIVISGHSKGGNVASYVAERHPNVISLEFQKGAGLPELLKSIQGKKDGKNELQFRTDNDLVSALGNNTIRNTGSVFSDGNPNPLKSHSIQTFLT